MKLKSCVVLLVLMVAAFPLFSIAENGTAHSDASHAAATAYAHLPLSFESDGAPGHYLARAGEYAVSVGARESSVAVRDAKSGLMQRISFSFEKANVAAQIEPLEALPGVTNYYIGQDARNWRLGVKNFAKLRVQEMYPGVDVVYYGDHRRLEFDFVVAPMADPGAIALAFSGAAKLYTSADGDLVVELNGHPVHFARPYAYQRVGGSNQPVSVEYVVADNGRAHLKIGEYDKSAELVIDPILSYSTYLGGSQGDTANGIAVDAAGEAYITGQTCSLGLEGTTPFPGVLPTPNSTGTTFEGVPGACDAYVTKLNAAGTLVFTTIIAGVNPSGPEPTPANGFAVGNGIALDNIALNPHPVPNNYPNVYVVGTTSFSDLPLTSPNPIGRSTAYNGGDSDAFITILDSTNGTLIRETYLGGNLADAGNAITVDPQQNVIVAGQTNSFNFPAYNGFEPIVEKYVAFVTKLDFGLHIAPPILPGASPMSFRPASASNLCGSLCPATPGAAGTYYFFSAVYGGQLVAPGPTWNYTVGANVPYGAITTVTPSCPSVSPPVNYPAMIVFAENPGMAGGINWGTCSSYGVNTIILDNGGINWLVLAVSPFVEPLYATTEAYGVALDPAGDVFVVGGSSTADLHPSLPGPAPVPGGLDWLGPADTHYPGTGTWIIKLLGKDSYTGSLDAGSPVYVTPVGTTPTDITQTVNAARAVAVDTLGRAYIVGTSTGGIYTTPASLNSSPIGGDDVFIVRMNTAGSGIDYSTYLGGTGNDQGLGVAVDAGGWAYIAGTTQSGANHTASIPVINPVIDANGVTRSAISGTQDAYLAKLSPDGTGLIMSAYLGGSSLDQGNAIAISQTGTGDIYVAGNTNSPDFPLNPLVNPADPIPGITQYAGNAGALYGFVTKILGASFPTVTVAPVSINFANQAVGWSSPATQTITLTSTGQATLNITSLTATGDFSQTNNCVGPLTPAGGTKTTCAIIVTFTPTAVGSRSGVITIVDDAINSPQTVGVMGNGVLVTDSVSPLALPFPTTVLGVTSAAQTVTVTNTDPVQTLIMSTPAASGDFTVSSNLCTSLLMPGQSCTIGMVFTPTAPGSRIGTLVINGNGTTFPTTVSLTGAGNGAGSPTNGNSGSGSGSGSPTTTFSLTGPGANETVTVTAATPGTFQIAVVPPTGYSGTVTLNCPAAMPAKTTCAINPPTITFQNGVAAGGATATVTVTSTASGGSSAPPTGTPWQANLMRHRALWASILPFGGLGLTLIGRRRRWLALLFLALCLVMGLAGCGGATTSTTSATSATTTPTASQMTITATNADGVVVATTTVLLQMS